MWLEHITGLIMGVVFWIFVASIIIVPMYLRYRDRGRMHETLRLAYEKGQPVPPELIAALQSNVAPRVASTPERDLRRAIVLIALGLGLGGLGYGLWYGLAGLDDWISGPIVAGAGAIPGLIGVAYFVLWLTRRNAAKS